jgi:hypothetical protein
LQEQVFLAPHLHFYWVPIVDVLQELLLDPEIGPFVRFGYRPKIKNHAFCFGKFTSGFWMDQGNVNSFGF